jgi:xanthine dehydrogenase accessory factor
MQVWSRLLAAIEAHGRAAMVTVVATKGSAPREAGARLLVNPDGTFTGTIGGGTLEWRAIALAQAALTRPGASKAETRKFILGPDMGQCCGGQVELALELFGAGERAAVGDLARREAAGPFNTSGRLSPEKGIERLVLDALDVPPGAAAMREGVLVEGFGDDRRPLILFGAGHVGRALVMALAPLPFAVTWVDPRPDALPEYLPANVVPSSLTDPGTVLAAAPAGAFVLVMTHSHQLDLAVVHAALADERFPYVGLIGSRSKRIRFERRLAEAGMSPKRIAALVCPIGVEGIASKAPPAIAAATVAQLLVRDEALRSAAAPVSHAGLPIGTHRRVG